MIITPFEAAEKMRRHADKAFRALIIEAGKRVILKTPVDTGRARGNWQISIGSPHTDEFEEDKNGSRTIMGVRYDTKDVDSGEVVYLLNGVPYIIHLERGTPRTPPHAMVAVTIEELQETAREVAAVIRRTQ